MKINFKRTLIFTLTILALWTGYNIYKWSTCGCSDKNFTLCDDEKSMIAWLSSDNKTLPRLRIARFKIEEPFKYPFFYPQYFSDFFILNIEGCDSLVFVLDNRDTLSSGGLKQIKKVPSKIKVFNRSKAQIAIYSPDTIYSDNIKHKPTISIFKQLVLFGPSFEQCMDKCN